jgi:hypothetical protein
MAKEKLVTGPRSALTPGQTVGRKLTSTKEGIEIS